MYKPTQLDRLNIQRLRFWKGLHSKYRKSHNLILRLSAWRAKRNVKDLDEHYFKPRVKEMLQKEGVTRNNLVGSGLHGHYSAFLFLVANMDKIRASGFPENCMHLFEADKPVTVKQLTGLSGDKARP